jgi:predicted outer membrane lipoprotein
MKSEIIEKMSTLLISAFGLVAALSWNSAIQSIFSTYYRQPGEDITSQVIYALTVTAIAVIVTVWLSRAAERAKKRDEAIQKKFKEISNNLRKLKEARTKK